MESSRSTKDKLIANLMPSNANDRSLTTPVSDDRGNSHEHTTHIEFESSVNNLRMYSRYLQ